MQLQTRWMPLSLCFAILAGCATAPVYQRPDLAMPSEWRTSAQGRAATPTSRSVPISPDWWRTFGSADLNALMQQALQANHDLAAATERIRQARAVVRGTDSQRYPTVTGSVAANKSRQRQASFSSSTASDQATLSVSYDIDLWGARNSSIQSAEAQLAATEFDRDAVALILQAEVARFHLQSLALQDRIDISNRSLSAAREILRLVQTRFDKGAATGLDLAQQRTAVATIEAQLPQLERALRATATGLAVLLGRAPQGFSAQNGSLLAVSLPTASAVQPNDLLMRRPDIRRAEAILLAANADVGAARAALYPEMRISAAAAAGGVLTSGSSLLASLATSLTQTLFDAGLRQSQVELSIAQREELVRQYLQTALVSLKEAQDGLDAVDLTSTRERLLQEAVTQARESYRIASVRFAAGSLDLLTLLDSQRTLLQAEDSLLQASLDRFLASVDLFKAMGGGFDYRDNDVPLAATAKR